MVVLYLNLFLMIIDCILIVDLRKLVYSFLLSKRNIAGAKKIHKAQTKIKRILLSYIKEYAIYPKHFNFFYRMWVLVLISLIPQYIIGFTVYLVSYYASIILYGVFIMVKIILSVIVYINFNSDRVSRFDKRY